MAARHLFNRGVQVAVTVVGGDLSPATARQLIVLRTIGVTDSAAPLESSLVIDALVGYALDGEPRGHVRSGNRVPTGRRRQPRAGGSPRP